MEDKQLIEKLSTQIVQPDELSEIAVKTKQWRQFLKIIEINELNVYDGQKIEIVEYLEDPEGC